MTIDEMIKALSNEPEFGDVWVEEATCKAVIAALKAAYAMRDAIELDEYDVDNCDVAHRGLRRAAEAWDAATEEDV
tara:strand:+ start:204 stop:431 length:228 start_codon:yes stop_codon:yes gene_type:complete